MILINNGGLMSDRKLVLDGNELMYDDLKQEQQILMDYIESCERAIANLTFQIDKEHISKQAYASMLKDSFEDKDTDNKKEKEDA